MRIVIMLNSFIFIINNNDKFEDSIETKNMIKNEIDKYLKDLDIDINFQIILENN